MSLQSNKANATRTSPVAEQEELDTDWVEATSTTLSTQPPELNVNVTSTSTSLVSSSTLTQGQEVTLVESDNSYTDGVLGAVSTSVTSLNTSTNPFGDGSLTHQWQLENNGNDDVGASTATLTNITYTASKFGQGMNKIANQGIATIANTTLAFGTGDFTLALWVNFSAFGLATRFFFSGTSSSGANTNGTALMVGSGGVPIWSPNNGTPTITGSTAISTSTDNFLLIERVSNVATLYLNNVSIGTVADLTNYGTSTDNTLYGITAANYTDAFTADQFMIFNRGLTAQEKTDLYTNGATEYTADITSFSLATAPTKAFLKDDTSISLAIESTPERIVNEVSTYLTVLDTTDTTNLVVTEPIYEGEKLFINDTEVTLGAVTESGTIDSLTVGTATSIATYKMDDAFTNSAGGELADDISTNFDGTAYNITSGTGNFAKCAVFNGTNSYIALADGAISGATDFSISAWFNSDTFSAYQVLLGYFNGVTNIRFMIGIQNGTDIIVDINDARDTFTTSYSLSIWNHLVVTRTGTDLKLYLNTNAPLSAVCDGNAIGTGDQFVIGKYIDTSKLFHGKVDQVRIFDRALTATDVTALYNETAMSYSVAHTLTATTPTKAYRVGTETLTFVSSTTLEYVGTSSKSGLLQDGDVLRVEV